MVLDDRRKALEDQFFKKQDEERLKKIREELRAKKAVDGLREVSAVHDDGVLQKLVEIGVQADTYLAIRLAPLVLMAWADGKVEENERVAVRRAADDQGVKRDSAAGLLLDEWLSHEPPESLFTTWLDYVKQLKQSLAEPELLSLEQAIVGGAQKVAEAAGGFLGLHKVSAEETALLQELESAFR